MSSDTLLTISDAEEILKGSERVLEGPRRPLWLCVCPCIYKRKERPLLALLGRTRTASALGLTRTRYEFAEG